MKLEEAKDQVAKKYECSNWEMLMLNLRQPDIRKTQSQILEEAAELYAQSKQADFFNSIEDLRPYLLRHPDQQMIRTSCLHFLGDKYQDFENTIKFKQADAWEEGYWANENSIGKTINPSNPYKITSPQSKQPNP